jgi:CheY-like chemotaxis protein
MEKFGRILMVEDDPRDVELTLTALEDYKLANEVVVCRDGQEALDYLYSPSSVIASMKIRRSCCSI